MKDPQSAVFPSAAKVGAVKGGEEQWNEKAKLASGGKLGIEELKQIVQDFAAQLNEKNAAVKQAAQAKSVLQDEFKTQVQLINDQFKKINDQASQDVQNAERQIKKLEE